MHSLVFGELIFNTGWKTNINIKLFENEFKIVVKAKAYFEKDGITPQQETAFIDFNNKQREQLKKVEVSLEGNYSVDAAKRFVPHTLLIQRDGEYALLLDDKNDESGIAVCLIPKFEILSQDDYL